MNESARRSQSSRAIYSREWRVINREKRRFNTLLSGYISVKYHCIYNEYGEFYNSLNQVHPEVRDLTKTATFKKWKKDQQSNEADEQESEQQQTDLPGQVDDQESEQQQQQQIDLPGQVDDQPEAGNLTKTKTYKRWKKDQESNHVANEIDETVPHGSPEESNHVPNEFDETVPHGSPEESNHVPNEFDETVPHGSPEAVLPATNEDFNEPDTLSRLVDESIPANPINTDDVDSIIDQIINELVQDDAVRNILEADELVHPH